jgi:DNA-dependent RNA polymerase auxiliary subunit epsilon
MISKNKTYWLTNSQDSVYNSLSNNKVYNLEFLSNIGDNFET